MIQKIKTNFIITFFGVKTEIKRLNKKKHKENLKNYYRYFFEISDRTPREFSIIMIFHRTVCIMGLALFKIMMEEGQSKKESINKIHKLFWGGPYGKNARFMSFFVRRAKNPFMTFLNHMGPFNEWFFPCPPWEKSRIDIENGIGWHQTECYYADFFRKENQLELCSAYGDCDCRVAELFPEVLELKREKAMCWGDEYCDFLYYKK